MIILNMIQINDDWIIFLGFFLIAVLVILSLWLFFRLMKWLNLRNHYMERKLEK